MTVTDKVLVYLCGLTLFGLWEAMFVAQMFRGEFIITSIVCILLGLMVFVYFVRIVRTEPLIKG